MYRFSYKKRDFDVLTKKIRQLDAAVVAEVSGSGTRAAAREVETRAKGLIRVRTGKSRATIRTEAYERQDGSQAHRVLAGLARYRVPLWLEFSTINMPAYPFLRPAIIQSQTPAYRKFAQASRRAWDKAVRRIASQK